MAQSPHIARVSFGAGAGWILSGSELLGRGGAGWLRVAAVLLIVSLVQVIPAIGPLLLLLVSPAITAGLLNAFRAVEQGEPLTHGHALAGLTDPRARPRMLALGSFFLLGTLAAFVALGAWLSPQMDLQALSAFMADPDAMNERPEEFLALFQGVNVFGGLAISALIMAVVLGALYFAVPLVFFWGWPVIAALLFSLRALLVNWIAFLGFGLVLVGLLIALGLLYGVVGGVLSLALGAAGALLVQLLTLAMSLFVQLLVASAQWKAFRDVFPAGDGPESGGGDGDDDNGAVSA